MQNCMSLGLSTEVSPTLSQRLLGIRALSEKKDISSNHLPNIHVCAHRQVLLSTLLRVACYLGKWLMRRLITGQHVKRKWKYLTPWYLSCHLPQPTFSDWGLWLCLSCDSIPRASLPIIPNPTFGGTLWSMPLAFKEYYNTHTDGT